MHAWGAVGAAGDEPRLAAFQAWLEAQGWSVTLEVNFCDVLARRGTQVLYAEAKGITSGRFAVEVIGVARSIRSLMLPSNVDSRSSRAR